mmetsp:Transcript_11205/g.18848  ORF Transcript_11205/g.18848 Transcript_11205/m.18848 type:complete len:232 (+) Transcript_11205:312-1007(+)|eukprot:CAMPEP_0168623192 /NCGR_PEP_ID=MMETSP0449_2-20121227/8690_1 /TAXON_ID=1082188 /ORGANISM="Strombidium rassoulzadegani, Strain ras09" /LENGTH=231 /DNA_ID=CAMNT_0008664549 /DNA_START=208 /DNA_END=903 /DNA_ORIENTATION=+
MEIGLLDKAAEGGSGPGVAILSVPQGGDRRLLSDHGVLELGRANLLGEVIPEDDAKIPALNSHVTESEGEVDVLVILNEVLDGQEYSVECILNHILAEHGGRGDGHWVCVDASKSFLVDGVLAHGGRYLLLAWVSHKVVLQEGVDHEHGLEVVNILPLQPLRLDVDLRTNRSLGNLGQLGLDVEGEGAELLDVDASSSLDVILNVLGERLPNDQHLSLGLEGLEVGRGSLS